MTADKCKFLSSNFAPRTTLFRSKGYKSRSFFDLLLLFKISCWLLSIIFLTLIISSSWMFLFLHPLRSPGLTTISPKPTVYILGHKALRSTVPNNSYSFWTDLVQKWPLLRYDWHPWILIRNPCLLIFHWLNLIMEKLKFT